MAVTHPGCASKSWRWFPMRPTDTPVRRFAVLALIALAIVGALGARFFGAAGAIPVVAGMAFFLAGALLPAWDLRRHHPHDQLGFANIVTLLRLALVSTLVIPLVGATPAPVAIVVIAVISLSLDGVDGRLARRQVLSSNFGGRFDMEVDSVFALGLTVPWLNATLPQRQRHLRRATVSAHRVAIAVVRRRARCHSDDRYRWRAALVVLARHCVAVADSDELSGGPAGAAASRRAGGSAPTPIPTPVPPPPASAPATQPARDTA